MSPLWSFRKSVTNRVWFFLSVVTISMTTSPTEAEPMVAQAIMMTNNQYGISRRLGTVVFTQTEYGSPVRIRGELKFEKSPNAQYGMHIHAFGNLTNGCDSTGPHFNPTGQKHGAPSDATRHLGDLGNIQVIDGRSQIDITDEQIQLTGPHSILGRSLVVHLNEDDNGKGGTDESLTTGNVGKPHACAIIGIATDFALVPPTEIKGATAKAVSSSPRSFGRIENFAIIALTVAFSLLRNRRATVS